MVEKKHAILIMAHGNLGTIETNVEILDSDNIDFFIHVDKKSNIENFSRNKVGWGLLKVFCIFQSSIRIDRIKNFKIYKGSNWCSLNREFVEYLISNRNLIYKYFSSGKCADELYKQSFFIKWIKIHTNYEWQNSNLRYINWEDKKASPKVLGIEDYASIKETNAIFCRKVLTNSKLIDLVLKNL